VTTWAIVVAAGRGERFGGPKLQTVLAGRRAVEWSVDAARAACDGVVLVVAAGDDPGVEADRRVDGGATRSESVRAGLTAVPDDADVVVVHDAARPAARPALFHAVVAAVRAGADAAVPGVPVTDTIKRVDGDAVVATLDRSSLVAVQTPQAFGAAALRAAHADAGDATDDAALVERRGGRVVVVPGDASNRKLTSPDDVAALERALS
jgi:2-C-methyl-D-erythritol 4-phosphate cytidylyltransferase